MSLLESAAWSDSLFTGDWTRGSGPAVGVEEPATGDEFGRITLATAADIAVAADGAAAAQQTWARTSLERAAVLRRAGDLFGEHAAEIEDWLVREAGSIPPKAQLETHTAAQECYEAAALPSHPLGEILATAKPRYHWPVASRPVWWASSRPSTSR